MLTYHPLTTDQYTASLLKLIVAAEGFEPIARDTSDGQITIGNGYTFQRERNVLIWERACA